MFEGALIALGAVFLALSVVCAYATIVLVVHFGDEDSAFPVGSSYLRGLKGFGLALFAVAAFVTFGVGWQLTGRRAARWIRSLRRRS